MMNRQKVVNPCPCGSGTALMACCEPYINSTKSAPTAEALMRSRYTAYVHHDEQYLLNSWHHSTRPDCIELDRSTQWLRLKIIASDYDHVEFVAIYRIQGKAYRLHEISRFINEDDQWFYVDGSIQPD